MGEPAPARGERDVDSGRGSGRAAQIRGAADDRVEAAELELGRVADEPDDGRAGRALDGGQQRGEAVAPREAMRCSLQPQLGSSASISTVTRRG